MINKKIRGVEHELAINTQPQLPQRSIRYLVGMAIEELKNIGLVSSIPVEEPAMDFIAYNGFRVYDDMSHLELSSPSYNHPIEAVVYDKIAELFGYYAVRGLDKYFKGVYAYKNNVSNQRQGEKWRSNAYSTHSSVLMDSNICNIDNWNNLESSLIPFMIARIPLFGGGDFVSKNMDGTLPRAGKYMFGDSLRYTISPRAVFIKRVSSNDTVDARGILNQRNDPHADPAKYWRLHDINWEAVRSPFQVYLRDALEVMVFTAYEHGYLKNPPRISDPVRSIRNISLETEDYEWKLELTNGSKIEVIQDVLIDHYLTGVEEMMTYEPATELDKQVFNLLEATLEAFNSRKLEYFIHGVDWITKKALIEEYAGNDLDLSVSICNQFTLLDDTVLAYVGEPTDSLNTTTTFNYNDSMEFVEDAIPWEDWSNFKEMIKNGLMNGPPGSRDYIRCLAIKEFQGLLKSVEWESINFHNVKIRLDEPFMYNKYMCGDILEKSTKTFTEFSYALDKLNKEKQNIVYAPSKDYEKEKMETS